MSLIHKAVFLFLFVSLSVTAAAQQDTLSYLALGDSYTIGESVEQNKRWPVQLKKALSKEGPYLADPNIIATTGWTTLDLKAAIEEAELNPPYDLVSLLIGVNDQYQGKDISAYPDNFRKLLNKAIELAGGRPGHVLVLSIPDYGVTPFGKERNPSRIDQELKEYNSINRQISEEMGVLYVDVFPSSKKAAKDKSLVASDGLHPSAQMYKLWVDETVPVLLPEIRKW